MNGDDLTAYIVYDRYGTPLLDATIDKFKMDLANLALMHHHGYSTKEIEQMASDINWTGFITEMVNDRGGYGALDKANIAEIVKSFSEKLGSSVQDLAKSEKARKDREGKRMSVIFEVFKELETDVIPEPTLIASALSLMGVRPKDIKEETKELEAVIRVMIDPKADPSPNADDISDEYKKDHADYNGKAILQRMAGPSGGVVLCHDANGKSTGAGTKYAKKLCTYIIRNRRNR